ncbi:MAG: hypothetical protein AVDCRST_MAG27-2024, partial [uncultured Craurococcus sp.]
DAALHRIAGAVLDGAEPRGARHRAAAHQHAASGGLAGRWDRPRRQQHLRLVRLARRADRLRHSHRALPPAAAAGAAGRSKAGGDAV